jgi:hypothetical protein
MRLVGGSPPNVLGRGFSGVHACSSVACSASSLKIVFGAGGSSVRASLSIPVVGGGSP